MAVQYTSCLSTLYFLALLRGKKFDRGDAFVGYQKDTPAAVVFQASNFLRRLREEDDDSVIHSKLEVLDRAGILENVPLNVLLDREEITELWKEAVCHFHDFKIFCKTDCRFSFLSPPNRCCLLVSSYSCKQLHRTPSFVYRTPSLRDEGRLRRCTSRSYTFIPSRSFWRISFSDVKAKGVY